MKTFEEFLRDNNTCVKAFGGEDIKWSEMSKLYDEYNELVKGDKKLFTRAELVDIMQVVDNAIDSEEFLTMEQWLSYILKVKVKTVPVKVFTVIPFFGGGNGSINLYALKSFVDREEASAYSSTFDYAEFVESEMV